MSACFRHSRIADRITPAKECWKSCEPTRAIAKLAFYTVAVQALSPMEELMKSLPVLALLASLVSPLASAAECANWQALHPTWLWCDDFESTASLGSRYEDISSDGMSVTANDGRDGSKALTQRYTTGQVDAGWIVKIKPEGYPDHIFYRFYHKFGTGYVSFPPKMSRVGYRNRSTWTEIFRVHTWLDRPTGTLTADVLAKNSTQANSGGYLSLLSANYSFANHINEWVAVEVELKLNTSGARDGIYRVWVNDSLVIERLNVDIRGSTADKINEVMLDAYWNGGATGNLNRYFDDFVISTQKIGLTAAAASTSPPMPPTDVDVRQQ